MKNMRDLWKKLLGALILAWNKQLRLALPEKMRNLYRKSGAPYEMAGFILLGAIGAFAVTAAALCAGLLFNRFGGALIFGIAAWVFWLFHDHGRGDGIIANTISSFLPGKEIPYSLVMTVFMMILKVALLMALFYYGRALMLIAVWAGVAGIEVLLLREAGFAPPVMDFSSDAAKKFWIVMSIVLVICFIVCPLGCALGALAFAGVWKFAGKRLAEADNPMDFIRFCGAAAGWLILLSAVLAI